MCVLDFEHAIAYPTLNTQIITKKKKSCTIIDSLGE